MTLQEHELDVLIRARYPVLWVVSPEEARVEDAVRRVVNGEKSVVVWSVTQPFDGASSRPAMDGVSQAFEAVDSIFKRVQGGARGGLSAARS
jgi:hypothetical protein